MRYRCGGVLLPACRVVELGHELAVGGAGSVQVLVAFGELEPQVCCLLFEVGEFVLEGVDVGGGAEPGLAPGLVAESFGQASFEVAVAGAEPERAFVGGEQVCLQGGPGDAGPGGAVAPGRGAASRAWIFSEQVAVPVEERAVDGGGPGDREQR